MKTIDLNCDMGESYGRWRLGEDAAIMPLVTSANIAAGFHGGDPATIRATVRLAVEHGVAIGAHPSLPDLMGFGRRAMKITPQEAYDLVLYQAGAVGAFARAAGARLHHVKCHGAFYNMAANDDALAQAIVRAVKDLGGETLLYALSGSRMLALAAAHGVRALAEVFADRGYEDDGTLAPRDAPGGMIEEAEKSVAQALRMAEEGVVVSRHGARVPVAADTMCLHGDQPGAVAFANALRRAFAARGLGFAAP
jgi:UPF0271 protein